MTEVSSTAPVIRARELARWYGPIIGLTDLSVDIPPGITGLLGPNGAGKSTLLRLITGQVFPSSGAIEVLGMNPTRQPELFAHIGFCSEDDVLWDDLTAIQTVTFLARCSGIPRSEASDRASAALDMCGLADAKGRRCGGFSKGMRQRTRIAAALVHQPRLLLLDEPMTGLDPLGRRQVVDIIRKFHQQGGSVIFSSHILHEVESVSTHIVIINRGMLLADGTAEEIRHSLSDYAFTLHIRCSEPRRLAEALVAHPHVGALAFRDDGALAVTTRSARVLTEQLPGLMLSLEIDVESLTCPNENLESLFERLTR